MLDYQLLVDQMSKEQIAVAKAVLKSALAKAKKSGSVTSVQGKEKFCIS